jgi:tetratricopeptide (TPR) repeat protein
MKKPRKQQIEIAERAKPSPAKSFVWWPWAAALAALFVAFEAYGPSVDGPFVFDDRYLPFFSPSVQALTVFGWMKGVRPLLMLSYWVDYSIGGIEPHSYHVTNVLLHFVTAVIIALIVFRLLERVVTEAYARTALSVFAGGLFLLHPLQTESVAYVASRSEVLSVMFFYAAVCVFLYKKPSESISIWRSLAILALFGAALTSKEHTLVLPALLLLLDLAWVREGWRKNALLYGMIAAVGAVGAFFVGRIVLRADTAGFSVKGMTPASYLFTQGRVLWNYLRMFVLPAGLNADPDIAISRSIFDGGAIFGLLALLALAVAAWVYRKTYPLAALGLAIFLLLIAPTSSIVPIVDVQYERRVYLPFLGLALIAIEFLRRLKFSQIVGVGAAILVMCTVLTYQRSEVWASSISLWEDTVAKSPKKVRPRFQIAYAQYELGHCPEAAEQYQIASTLGPPDYTLLTDWALALDCAGHSAEAIEKLEQATHLEKNAHAFAQIGMIYGKQRKNEQALAALDQAEHLNPGFAMTYVYRGNVFEVSGDCGRAVQEYRRALAIDIHAANADDLAIAAEAARAGIARLANCR